jgi:Helicase associated domain
VLSGQDPSSQATRKRRECYASQWNQHFEALKDYVAKNGHAQVTLKENKSLHGFVDRQRQKRQAGDEELQPERIRQLEAIGMTWCVQKEEWEGNFEKLKRFKELHGHLDVKKSDDPSLLIWIKTQRVARFGKRSSRMSKERQEKLDQIGFVWNSRDELWNQRYHELEEYIKVHGHCCLPLKCQDYPVLANWVDSQRHEFKNLKNGTRSSMTEERIQLLNKIGFVYSYRDAEWSKKYEQLKAFIEENGRRPTNKTNKRLHSWLSNQWTLARRKFDGEETSLSDERAMRLREIGCLHLLD